MAARINFRLYSIHILIYAFKKNNKIIISFKVLKNFGFLLTEAYDFLSRFENDIVISFPNY